MKSSAGRLLAVTWLGVSGFFAACDGPGITEPERPADVRPYVTGAAAAAVGADGLFTFPEPQAPGAEPIISAERARDLAAAFVRTYGPAYEPLWEEEAGRDIALAQLRPDARTLYAHSPYELFPDGFHPAFRRAFGPFHLVWMRSGNDTPLVIAVSAYNREVTIDSDGMLVVPPNRGMEFFPQVLPASNRPAIIAPLLPEEAVVRVARLTGARITERLEHVLREFPSGPLGGVWKLTLDRPVRVRTVDGGRTAEVRELYIGRLRGSQLFIPAAEQPRETVTSAFRIPPVGQEPVWETVRLAVRPGVPAVFDEVTVVRSN